MPQRPHDHSSRRGQGELADEELAERFAAEEPEEFLRRREFLSRTAALAGAAGLAGAVPLDSLVAEAARKTTRPLPNQRNVPIDTFVVLMMENRSFDHYFGWHPRADGRNRGLSYPDIHGKRHRTYHLTPDYQGCDFRDPDHGWNGGRHQMGRGRMDGFYRGNEHGTGSDELAIGYYLKDDLGFLPAAADAFTLYDRWFCSVMASTFPNRHYQLAGQNGGQKSNEFPLNEDLGFTWETIFDRAKARGVSAAYYVSDLPVPALYGLRGLSWIRPAIQFYVDAALGTLPNICFIDPPFQDIGALGLGASDHPHSDIRLGQAWMSDVVHAFLQSPQYRRGALFINYDEWGGFFDHVRPPRVRDDRGNRRDLMNDWGQTGFRIPGVAISPYTRGRRRVSHMQVTHESILKFISYRFGLGHLTRRDRYASNIGRSFDFRKRDFDPPLLPNPEQTLATPCLLQGGGRTRLANPEPHDLAKLETSGLLERLGYEVPKMSLDQIFRAPDAIKKALEQSGEVPQ